MDNGGIGFGLGLDNKEKKYYYNPAVLINIISVMS